MLFKELQVVATKNQESSLPFGWILHLLEVFYPISQRKSDRAILKNI
ncbi:MAG: hypothetical protein ACTTJS_04325 [Wolinella sp.]